MLVRQLGVDPAPALRGLPDDARDLELVVQLLRGPVRDPPGGVPEVPTRTHAGRAGDDDGARAARVADGEVQEPGGQGALLQDGLARVEDVFLGAGEVREVARGDGEVHGHVFDVGCAAEVL